MRDLSRVPALWLTVWLTVNSMLCCFSCECDFVGLRTQCGWYYDVSSESVPMDRGINLHVDVTAHSLNVSWENIFLKQFFLKASCVIPPIKQQSVATKKKQERKHKNAVAKEKVARHSFKLMSKHVEKVVID